MKEQAYIQIYTGDGKGKTTAAFGAALRALAAGKNVFIAQFIKSMSYNENRLTQLVEKADSSFGKLEITLCGRGCFIHRNPEVEDIEMAKNALNRCADVLERGNYDLVILDEICVAIYLALLSVDEVLEVLQRRNPQVEVILTGRNAPQALIDFADLVSEMREIKHYYHQGVLSRNGFDH